MNIVTKLRVLELIRATRQYEVSSTGKRIIVANQLPLKAFRDEESGNRSFEWEEGFLAFQVREGLLPKYEVVHLGCLPVEVDPLEQEKVSQLLFDKFRCVPVFMPSDIFNKYYHGFCKHYLWPLLHSIMPLVPSDSFMFEEEAWSAYVSANKIFAEKILEILNPDEDCVWLHDYHLMAVPCFLRQKQHKMKLGFFLHSPFPGCEIYQTFPMKEEILRSLFNCDILGFQRFDYAEPFLNSCEAILDLEPYFQFGSIRVPYCGRTVSIRILPVGVHMGQLESVISSPETFRKVHELNEKYKGKMVILGVDDMDSVKGISFKFFALENLLREKPQYRGVLELVQIINPARTFGQDVHKAQDEIREVARKINQELGSPGYEPIFCITDPLTKQEKMAYYAISECILVNSFRDGMNLVPYEYTVARQGSPYLDKAFGAQGVKDEKKSMIIVSEFIGCSASLHGAIRINPWDIYEISKAMKEAISAPEIDKETIHKMHYEFISTKNIGYWARTLDDELAKASWQNRGKQYWPFSSGLYFRLVNVKPSIKLPERDILSAYKATSNRLIVIDYDDTMIPVDELNKAPTPRIISILNDLCSDPKNSVFLISGKGTDLLSSWFSQCKDLGLFAEDGYFNRCNENSPWQPPAPVTNMSWKNIALRVLERATREACGSFLERKETAVVWHHRTLGHEFGSFHSKNLHKYLKDVLVHHNVTVKTGYYTVEVKPKVANKGRVVEDLIANMRHKGKASDFVLCMGNDIGDDDMFVGVEKIIVNSVLPTETKVVGCTVDQRPSKAEYFLYDTSEVLQFLEDLNACRV